MAFRVNRFGTVNNNENIIEKSPNRKKSPNDNIPDENYKNKQDLAWRAENAKAAQQKLLINNHRSPNPNSYPDYSSATRGTRLPKNVPVRLTGKEELKLSSGEKAVILDLGRNDLQYLFRQMRVGESITVGRAADLKLTDNQTVSRIHLILEKAQKGILVTDVSTNGTYIERQYTSINPNELVRYEGNEGKPINPNYISAAKDTRTYLNEAITSGYYTSNYINYFNTICKSHVIAYQGFDGNKKWYEDVGKGKIDIHPGEVRRPGILRNRRLNEASMCEDIARQYNDPYRVLSDSVVRLEGIPIQFLPRNIGTYDYEDNCIDYCHYYPDGWAMDDYFEQLYRTAKEAVYLIDNNATQKEILYKLAEHYQYAANARPFGQINNSLFMNEVNTLLQKAGMRTMPHGDLDNVAQRLQPDSFKRYFYDQYYKTALK